MSKDLSPELDSFTMDLLEELFAPRRDASAPSQDQKDTVAKLKAQADVQGLTTPIVELFSILRRLHGEHGVTPAQLDVSRDELLALARRHARLDEHGVSIGARVGQALPMVNKAKTRIEEYLALHAAQAPSGIEVWDKILDNQARIRKMLNMGAEDWNSFSGQLRHAVESVETLARIVDLPAKAAQDVARVTKHYRMRLTPYYASLILSGKVNDPVLLQSVPSVEMLDNAGGEILPAAADHSPARLIDRLHPRVASIKATNMCAMYCTHCLGIAHTGAGDSSYSKEAYNEALDYIRADPAIRDVSITGADSLVLPNSMLQWLLGELDAIDHVRVKRLETRIPVTTPQRIDTELLDILEASNDRKPLRVVTQINTAQEITPVSKAALQAVSKRVFAVMNQAVLLKGVNDTGVKMWKLCETIQEAYVRPSYVLNYGYRDLRFKHLRVPVAIGQEIVESMHGNISGDAVPRYIAANGGNIPLHRTNLLGRKDGGVRMSKPWNKERVLYPDADPGEYARQGFGFASY